MPPADEQPTLPKPPRRWPHELHRPVVWLVIGLVALGLILVAVFHKSPPAPEPPAPNAQVVVTNSGFSPKTIYVKPGSQVSWTNRDVKPHEVAADPYPKDSSIPGFNSHVLLQTGDSYSFSFAKAGTYHYHDQLNPFKLMGTVVVK